MGRTLVSRHDSPLGCWTRALYFPDPPLAACVEMFWYVAGRADFVRDRRLPTGKSHLLFNLATAPILFGRQAHEPERRFPTCWVAGQQSRYIETGSQGQTILLGAQFRSHGAYRLLHIGQHELCDQVIELEALLGDRVLGLREQLLHCASPEAAFTHLERWLLGLLHKGAEVHPAVVETSRLLAQSPGNLQLAALSRHLGLSKEHLIRRFRAQVGMTPKSYANVLRFNQALAKARASASTWSEIAQNCGYFDQAHLANDFRRYAGRTPSSLLQDKMPDGESIVVG
jgi:AraC-like DNA-binding protein